MRGFVNSSALMVLAFTVVVLFFTYTLFENDMHNAMPTGLIVEKARWHGDAVSLYCQKSGTEPSLAVGSSEFVRNFGPSSSKNGAQAEVGESLNNEIFTIQVEYTRNYPPNTKFVSPASSPISGNTLFQWHFCDPDKDALSFKLEYNDTAATWSEIPAEAYPTSPPESHINTHLLNVSKLGSGTYQFRVTAADPRGATGFDTITREVKLN